MNKRQRKKQLNKELALIESDTYFCEECGKRLDLKNNWHHKVWGTCDSTCYAYLVGMSPSDFY